MATLKLLSPVLIKITDIKKEGKKAMDNTRNSSPGGLIAIHVSGFHSAV